MRWQRRRFWRPWLLYPCLGRSALSAAKFISVSEMVLLLCVPFMLRTQRSREHFRGLISPA